MGNMRSLQHVAPSGGFIFTSSSAHYTGGAMLKGPLVAIAFLLGGPLAAAQTPVSVAVSGVIQDQTGAVLPGAAVELRTSAGTVAQATTTDGAGAFRFEYVPPGP